MKLKPDDIMQEGDVIHYPEEPKAIVGKNIGCVGWMVKELPSFPTSHVTRPTGGRPTKKEEALRATCVKQQARIEELEKAYFITRQTFYNLTRSMTGDDLTIADNELTNIHKVLHP